MLHRHVDDHREKRDIQNSDNTLRPEADFLPITTEDYLDLIDWTARLTRPDKRGSIDATEPPTTGTPTICRDAQAAKTGIDNR